MHQAHIGDVGCVVWDAALVLAKYLENTRWSDLNGRSVIELGAGTGLISLCCCLAGADVVCTDLKELLPLIELNMKENEHFLKGKFESRELKWGESVDEFPFFDFIIMSDVIYYEESIKPLTDTIYKLSNKNTEVLVCYEDRMEGNKQYLKQQFFEILGENFEIKTIPKNQQDTKFQSHDIHVVSMKRKYSS
ncbi:protein N-lysine methyltransferase METTL21D-like [Xenia sp. Carnegie-2017]|uniref:protein N-lysine methyltransferase METTL21D-like n=1 Tax=Xenia sp. Carnegie-2017 TaxID=2897299 RepID=UPI001F03CC2A|nr:protein N-lysine methyltransferase METTL21D-like [Xenia sp. Carnegie-2017]